MTSAKQPELQKEPQIIQSDFFLFRTRSTYLKCMKHTAFEIEAAVPEDSLRPAEASFRPADASLLSVCALTASKLVCRSKKSRATGPCLGRIFSALLLPHSSSVICSGAYSDKVNHGFTFRRLQGGSAGLSWFLQSAGPSSCRVSPAEARVGIQHPPAAPKAESTPRVPRT